MDYGLFTPRTSTCCAQRNLHSDREVSINSKCVVAGSSVFTCIGALGTPSRTGPSLESIYRVSLTVDLCEGK